MSQLPTSSYPRVYARVLGIYSDQKLNLSRYDLPRRVPPSPALIGAYHAVAIARLAPISYGRNRHTCKQDVAMEVQQGSFSTDSSRIVGWLMSAPARQRRTGAEPEALRWPGSRESNC